MDSNEPKNLKNKKSGKHRKSDVCKSKNDFIQKLAEEQAMADENNNNKNLVRESQARGKFNL